MISLKELQNLIHAKFGIEPTEPTPDAACWFARA
jgi:hypothetical protein